MATGMNKVFLLGNLGNEPELRHYDKGTNLRFRLATTERWRDKTTGELKEHTEWHNVSMWGKRADALGKILGKGQRIMVEGRLETRSYESDGTTKYFTEVKAQDVFLSGGPRRSVVDDSEITFTGLGDDAAQPVA